MSAIAPSAIEREQREAEEQLPQAPLNPEKVAEYARRQRRAYNNGDYLRRALMLAGAVEAVTAADAFSGSNIS